MKSKTETLIEAMQNLSREIHSGDGIANAAIFEASERLEQQAKRIAKLESELLDIRAYFQCDCDHQSCFYCSTKASIDKALKGGDL